MLKGEVFLSFRVWFCLFPLLTFSCPVLSYHVISCFDLFFILSCLIFSFHPLVLSCPVPSQPFLSCTLKYCHVLSNNALFVFSTSPISFFVWFCPYIFLSWSWLVHSRPVLYRLVLFYPVLWNSYTLLSAISCPLCCPILSWVLYCHHVLSCCPMQPLLFIFGPFLSYHVIFFLCYNKIIQIVVLIGLKQDFTQYWK